MFNKADSVFPVLFGVFLFPVVSFPWLFVVVLWALSNLNYVAAILDNFLRRRWNFHRSNFLRYRRI